MSKVGAPGFDIGWASSARTTSATRNTYRRCTGWTSSSATSITSTPRRNPSNSTIRTLIGSPDCTYYDWFLHHDYFVLYAIAMSTEFLDTFKEFPPRHPPASFTIDQAVEKLHQFLARD
jgi:hypothetical protein